MANSKYLLHGLNLTDGQLEKIIRASQNDESVVVRISKDNLNGNMHKIPFTKTQVKRITRAKNGFNLSLSSAQLKYLKKSGGILPLLALLPLIFGGLGALGVAGAWLRPYRLPKMPALPLLRLQKWNVTIVKLNLS